MTDPTPFPAAHAAGETWQQAVGDILRQLGPVEARYRLGFVYCGPAFAPELEDMAVFLRQTTGVPHWVGGIGAGVVGLSPEGDGAEYFDESAVAVMICDFDPTHFRVFDGVNEGAEPLSEPNESWLGAVGPPLVIAHGDPGNGLLLSLIEDVAEDTDGFMVGGLGLFPGQPGQLADKATSAGLSGAMLSMMHVPVQTGLSQGCAPIGPARTVTGGDGATLTTIDGRPALEVFNEDIGELLARDLRRCSGYIFAGLPIPGSDTRDYLVRDLVALDPSEDTVTINAHVRPGEQILFCRRDPAAAAEDMDAMLADLKKRIGRRTVRGGLYFSCVARGPGQFDRARPEIKMIEDAFGPIPLVGFFGNGEISHNRLYAYTGVLTLFLS